MFSNIFHRIEMPEMYRVRQTFHQPKIDDIERAVFETLEKNKLSSRLIPGSHIAITGSSRGIQNLSLILRTIVRWVKKNNCTPFIIPAMGSHGGATAEGQLQILSDSGITDSYCECAINASMDVTCIGKTEYANDVYIDSYAAKADGIIVVNRIKAHTSFRGQYESGLMKMMAIGLGKQYGAQICHQHGFGKMHERIPEFGHAVLKNAKILFGVGIVENAHEETSKIEAVPAEQIPLIEPFLLEESKSLQAKIPFSFANLLIIDKIGKEFSGSGFDTNITGRYLDQITGSRDYIASGFKAEKITALDISEKSHGNAAGIGLIDFITNRIARKIDRESTYLNCLTAHDTAGMFLPPYFDSDKEAIQAGLYYSSHTIGSVPKIIRIHDTLHLDEFYDWP